METLLLKELFRNTAEYADKEVLVKGWIRNNRNSNKFGFVELNDGSFFKSVQVVYEEEFLLTVEDNGVGFNTNSIVLDSARNHIGLSNVEERLKRMCQGSLEIESEIGRGTVCTVHIPKGAKSWLQ